MKKILVTTTVVALASAASLGLSGTSANAAAPPGASAKVQATEFALQTSGFGSRVRGGQVPAGSGSSAW